jgi:diaminopimelate decarboxylase
MLDSKFGMSEADIEGLRRTLGSLQHGVVRGLHCHLGSTLRSVQPVADATRLLVALVARLRADGHPIDTLDLGGGLDIDYARRGEALPTPADLIAAVRPALLDSGLRLWLEPGRSLVGNTGALVGRVIGVKHNGRRGFLIVDASMAQLIRPSLYDAYHHIEVLEEPAQARRLFCDVVGPICESSDFLGKDRDLPLPEEGDGVIIHDAGAYGFSMASRYNLNLLPAEYVIDGAAVRRSRRAETFDDFARTFADQPIDITPGRSQT